MLRARIAVAAAGLPLLALLLALPADRFALAAAAVLAAAAYEFTRATNVSAGRIVALAAAFATSALAGAVRTTTTVQPWVLLPAATLALIAVLRPRPDMRRPGVAWWVAGVLYVGVLGTYLPLLRDRVDGQRWLVALLAITFATDTGAYAVGRAWGRHLLIPRLSPQKTWEGAAGAIAVGGTAAALAPRLLSLHPAPALAASLVLVLPIAAIAGDLLESALKRRAGLKDFSHLLPGHGGLLDRLDSVLLTAPSLYWLLRWWTA